MASEELHNMKEYTAEKGEPTKDVGLEKTGQAGQSAQGAAQTAQDKASAAKGQIGSTLDQVSSQGLQLSYSFTALH
jgi:hypothetical protein